MSQRSGVKHATVPQVSRKKRALKMLENQLLSGKKTVKGTRNDKTDLLDSDIKRIQKEIEILKSRV